MLRTDVFPSRFVKATDLPTPRAVGIAEAQLETLKSPLGQERKLVLSFADFDKHLAVNRTNFDAIAGLLGSNTDNWIGKSLELYATKTFVRRKETDCVRVRAAGGVL